MSDNGQRTTISGREPSRYLSTYVLFPTVCTDVGAEFTNEDAGELRLTLVRGKLCNILYIGISTSSNHPQEVSTHVVSRSRDPYSHSHSPWVTRPVWAWREEALEKSKTVCISKTLDLPNYYVCREKLL